MRITVYAGSSSNALPTLHNLAAQLGREIARRDHTLVYGGGRTGLMGAVADAALGAGGRVEGVILDAFIEHDVHHRGLSELVVVTDMRERKAGLDRPADAFVALPGGYGTFEELAEILSFRKLRLHERPVVLLDPPGESSFWRPWKQLLENAVAAGFEKTDRLGYFEITDDPARAVGLCEASPMDS